jgi:hypothetical protein
MDNAWIGAIGASVGAIVGGLLHHFASRSTFLRERNWERDELIQQKLEEIYVLTLVILPHIGFIAEGKR